MNDYLWLALFTLGIFVGGATFAIGLVGLREEFRARRTLPSTGLADVWDTDAAGA